MLEFLIVLAASSVTSKVRLARSKRQSRTNLILLCAVPALMAATPLVGGGLSAAGQCRLNRDCVMQTYKSEAQSFAVKYFWAIYNPWLTGEGLSAGLAVMYWSAMITTYMQILLFFVALRSLIFGAFPGRNTETKSRDAIATLKPNPANLTGALTKGGPIKSFQAPNRTF